MKHNPGKEAETIAEKTRNHPCFHCGASGSARIHLPIAPACNIQCNYCVRKFDCVNESRPGVVSAVQTPEQAVERFRAVKKAMPNLTVVGIAGPGDPLANFDQVRQALLRIRAIDPGITFCLSTNGLMLPFYMNHLISLGVTHVTVTVNAVDTSTGAKIYDHVDYLGRRYTGEAGAAILMQNQLSGIRYLASMGVVVKVNIVLIRGINDREIEEIVFTVRDCGCSITNIMQLIPVKGSRFEDLKIVSNAELTRIRKGCEAMLPQMYHCRQCRADAVGTLDQDVSLRYAPCSKESFGTGKSTAGFPEPEASSGRRLRFAVASRGGALIDQHFGHAERFMIYDLEDIGPVLAGIREAATYCADPANGEDEEKLRATVKLLADCDGVLCLRIGLVPSRALEQAGIRVFAMYNRIHQGVTEAAEVLRRENTARPGAVPPEQIGRGQGKDGESHETTLPAACAL